MASRTTTGAETGLVNRTDEAEADIATTTEYDTTSWKWSEAFPFLAAKSEIVESKLEQMDHARLGLDGGVGRIVYCQFLCCLIQYATSNSIPPINCSKRLLFECGDVVTDCVMAELAHKLETSLVLMKEGLLKRIELADFTKSEALQSTTEFSNLLGCVNFVTSESPVFLKALPQLSDTVELLEVLGEEVRVLHLYILAVTHLASATMAPCDASVVSLGTGYATAFRLALSKLPQSEQHDLFPSSKLIEDLWVDTHAVYGNHLASVGQFRAAKSIYSVSNKLDKEQLAVTRLLHLDLNASVSASTDSAVVKPELPRFKKTGPLRLGNSPFVSNVAKIVFVFETPQSSSVQTS